MLTPRGPISLTARSATTRSCSALAAALLWLLVVAAALRAAEAPPTPPTPAAPAAPAATAATVIDDEAPLGPPMLYLFIIDDSSSMHENDPNNLRLQAAQLVLALAHDQDQWAVVRFRQEANLRLKPTPVGKIAERFKDGAALSENDVSDSPDGTNFLSAFASAQDVLAAWKGAGRVMAIFLTDGEDIAASNDQLSFSVHSLARKAYAHGASDFQMRIFGIGKGVSPAQLSLIREESKGSLVQVANAADLIDRVVSGIIEGHNIGRLDLPLPKKFELGPDVIRIGIIGVGGVAGPDVGEPPPIGYLKRVTVGQFGKTLELLDEADCLRYPPLEEFRKPGRYQIAVADHPPAGTYTIELAPGFELVDIVVERRLSFLVNPVKPPGRVAQFDPFELSVFMVGSGKDMRGLAQRTRVTADIFGPFSPNLEASGRLFNSNTRVGQPIELKFDDDPDSTHLEFSARVNGLSLTDDQMRDGSFTVIFRAVTRENTALTWTRVLPSRDIYVERLPGSLRLTVTDPPARFAAVDQLRTDASVRLLNTYLEPLPVLVELHPARPR
ncbi:MAG TPA: VWA domain-containing protein, partial [Planctomycetota bacterium]|nr:VWA domain-containing protein [Planctomycetota bacterium]